MSAVPEQTKAPDNASGAGSREVARVSARSLILLGVYLIVLFGGTVVAMLGVWSAIPLPAQSSQQAVAVPGVQPAAGMQATNAETHEPSDFRQHVTNWPRALREDVRYLLLVLIMGTMGGTLYGMIALCHHLAMRDFKSEWQLWYWFRPPLGAGLALLLYLTTRGGFLTLSEQPNSLTLCSTAALAGLCGMFSEQASKKLAEVFKTLFRTEDDVERSREEREKKRRDAENWGSGASAPSAAPTGAAQPQPNPADKAPPPPAK